MTFKTQIRLDYRSRRGLALGFEPDIRYGDDKKSWARLRTYFLRDTNPDINRTSEVRVGVPKDRYRMSVQRPDGISPRISTASPTSPN